MVISQKLLPVIVKNKCRLCGGTANRKKLFFFSDSGKSFELKRIIFKLCDVVVSETDELPQLCCRNYDKFLRLNKNIEIFTSTCHSAQKMFERELKTSRQANVKKRSCNGSTPTSTEKA